MVMRELLISAVATGVLLLGLMGAHTPTPSPGAASEPDRTSAALHDGSTGLPSAGAEIAS
jgi:hypothetical protein